MRMIVKVQRPVVTNDPAELSLVYAEGRFGLVQQSLDAATVAAMGEDFKAYFDAELRKDGSWSIGKRVKNLEW